MMTARGCEWSNCAFCNHHATYKGYRELSQDRVVETIETYKKRYKTDMIMFHDETFTARRARNIVDQLPDANYFSYAYPKGYNKTLLKKMYDKGFRVLVWGVESGCQDILNSMRKGTQADEVAQILKDSHEVGITNVAFIMFGFPGETREHAEETVQFLNRNAEYIERHAATTFRLEENSPIWQRPEIWGVEDLGRGRYKARNGMQHGDVVRFPEEMNKRNIKTAANTKYYMPGDSEFRAYFFMQVVYGEGSGDYPVRNGILAGDRIIPSMLMKNVSRPVVQLSEEELKPYSKCDGKHKVDASVFERYPYVVYYESPFR
jgi:radical SAM superfamily enzyme YgiQ (UPF0313 family)